MLARVRQAIQSCGEIDHDDDLNSEGDEDDSDDSYGDWGESSNSNSNRESYYSEIEEDSDFGSEKVQSSASSSIGELSGRDEWEDVSGSSEKSSPGEWESDSD